MSIRILLVYGGRSGGRTEQLRQAVSDGIRSGGTTVTLRELPAFEADIEDLLWADGVMLGTPEHFGYMSGALKDFFDRTFYPAEGRTEGRPYALFVSAGNDGRGTVAAVERIVAGYRWRAIAPPLIAVGDLETTTLARARELGATLVAGLEAGIF